MVVANSAHGINSCVHSLCDMPHPEPLIPIPPPAGKILQVVDNKDGSLAKIICLSIESTFDQRQLRANKRSKDERIEGENKPIYFPTLTRPFVISRLPASIETYSCVDERSFIRAVSKAYQQSVNRSGQERGPCVTLEPGRAVLTFPLIIVLLDSEMRSFIGYWGIAAVRMAARSGCRVLIVSVDGTVWADDVEQHCVLVNGRLHIVSNFGTESSTSSEGTRAGE